MAVEFHCMSGRVLKKNDIILAAVVIIAAFLALIIIHSVRSEGAEVVVTVTENGTSTIVGRYPLDVPREEDVEVSSGMNHISIHDGKVWVTSADCPDKICVNNYSDGICLEGETIVCLPHGLVVSIEGGEDSGIDAVVN